MTEIAFYKQDNYIEIRRKFTGAWTNLRLELHRQSNKFWKEGGDEFEDDEQFFPPETADELLFTLTGGTTKAVARRLFSDFYSYRGKPGDFIEASIAGNFADVISYPSETETLDECNNPFVLPLNKFNYAEFKRRFATRWTNLSIEIYHGETTNGDSMELTDYFEMRNFTSVNRLVINELYERDGVRDVIEKLVNEAVLRDEIYLSALEESLKRSDISFRIKNNRLGIYWGKNTTYRQLKEFQAADFLENKKGDE